MSYAALHFCSGLAYHVFGSWLLGSCVRLWWMHPARRALELGPYLTAAGIRVVLNLLPVASLLGIAMLLYGADHILEGISGQLCSGLLGYSIGPRSVFEGLTVFEGLISIMLFLLLAQRWLKDWFGA